MTRTRTVAACLSDASQPASAPDLVQVLLDAQQCDFNEESVKLVRSAMLHHGINPENMKRIFL